MRKSLPLAILAALAMSAITGLGTASAATEFGSGCAANTSTSGAVWVSTGHSSLSPLPVTAPTSGVITEWKVTSNQEATSEGELAGEFPRIFQPRLLVLRSAGPGAFTVVGEASGGPLNLRATNTYRARVPVQAGDFLGLAGNPYALSCVTEDEADTIADTVGGTPVGSTFRAKTATGIQVPVTARIEPDADGDGYGDETQDQCPQSASYQAACPVITVSSLSLARPHAVMVYVSSSLTARVAVTGTVTLARDRKVTLRAPHKTVIPGRFARFRLALTRPVRRALRALAPRKLLRLSIVASAANLAAPPSVARSTLKLRGQARIVHHKRTAHHRRHAHHKKRRRG